MPHDPSPTLITRRVALSWFARAATLAGLSIPALRASRVVAAIVNPATGYGRDPNLVEPHRPWPLTLSVSERKVLETLADALLPADTHGPAPSAVGIADFFDEWLSAPYPIQQADRALIVPALGGDASNDDSFVNRFGELCLLGYYTSPEGMKDIGYVEPTPSQEWKGPPEVVLSRMQFAGK